MISSSNARESRWLGTWNKLRAEAPHDAFANLCTQYAEPQRAYHTMQHIDECFAAFDRAAVATDHAGEVEFAIWLHDAVYDSHRPDNEEQSAAQAEAWLSASGAATESIERVNALILATKHDREPQSPDEALVVDIDLAILAAADDRFDEYESQVREEYAWVEWDAFRAGRRRILQSFLDRSKIYATPQFVELERRARGNLERSIRKLSL